MNRFHVGQLTVFAPAIRVLIGGGLALFCLFADGVCLGQVVTLSPATLKTLSEVSKSNPELATAIGQKLESVSRLSRNYGFGYVVFGRVVVEGDIDVRAVVCQMRINADGSFVDVVGNSGNPIGFRLHGYEPVDVMPAWSGPLEDLGVIRLKPLPADRMASAVGRVRIEKYPGAPRPTQVNMGWTIVADPTNTLTGGTMGTSSLAQRPIKSKVAADGTYSISGMSAAKYKLVIKAPDCVTQEQIVDFVEGETKELEPIHLEVSRKMDVEFAVAPEVKFQSASIQTVKLGAGDRWRVSEEMPKHGSDLVIDQKGGKLQMSARYGPCRIADLGISDLRAKLGIGAGDVQFVDRFRPDSIPIEEGHVYIVHQVFWKHWFLFRATFDEKSAALQIASAPDKSSAAPPSSAGPTEASTLATAEQTPPLTKREKRVKALYWWAKANEDREHAKVAMKALDELLEMEPKHEDGRRLRAKVEKLLPVEE